MNARKMLAACAALVMGAAVFALDGREIMQKVDDVAEPSYTHTLVKMDLIEANGTTESRVLEEWGRSKDGLASVVMIFKSPASVKDTRFLQIQNEGRDDDKWIYLPALRSTRRIASSEGSKSFMGTDATYDDMSSRDVDADTHTLLGDKSVNGYDCWEVKSEPKDTASSQYLYRVSCIDKATLLPVYTEMFDKKGNLVKVLTVEKIQNVGGYNIPMSNLLKNVQTGHSTRMAITNIEVDKAVPDKVFTQNFLNTGRL
ncbi:outer membrane lipoprotein-sorting protein [Treponema brennaborense]|uniref:Sigma E regulatory protein, MucB/RseB n=1 Tax=Treponema brennaborense (strain DSM 12168 / CIP 105900 / DD5/3) TaxID=906968 RepID=F4LJ71_TREBD|nr:outer membrane lipoprotein-sorting protein [Treponema brennaborense]AEE16328.1 putative sigma E regulatory protein, MucB/RseB [Treponema brennaborense DSM 12168]